jgi:uncharacterized C2H2 Zn-finger protein
MTDRRCPHMHECGCSKPCGNWSEMTSRDQAIAEGYKDEACPKCGAVFEAQIHFIRCDAKPCPMVSTQEPRTLLQRLIDGD